MNTYEELRADLERRGYREIAEADGLKPGERVRNYGEQFVRAYREGTATVLAVMERSPSSWSVSYERRDIEVIVERDAWRVEQGMGRFSVWADYGTFLAKGALTW